MAHRVESMPLIGSPLTRRDPHDFRELPSTVGGRFSLGVTVSGSARIRQIAKNSDAEIDAGHQKMVAGTGAGDIEQVTLGVLHSSRSASSATLSLRSCNGITSSQARTAAAQNSESLIS
jgi:hypothetical protein